MIEATDTAELLGDNTSDFVVASAAPPAPPTPQAAPQVFVMAKDEVFTREQYHAAGWTDEQLVQAGKMHTIAPPPSVELTKPLGMPKSKWVQLDDNDDIPPTGLFVGHNGVGFLIQAGMPALVPEHVLGILDDATMDAPVIDPKTRQVIAYRPRPRFTYREVPAPSDV